MRGQRGSRGSGAAAQDAAGDGERSKVPYQPDGRWLRFRRAPRAAAAAAAAAGDGDRQFSSLSPSMVRTFTFHVYQDNGRPNMLTNQHIVFDF